MARPKSRRIRWRWIVSALLLLATIDFIIFRSSVAQMDRGQALSGDAIVALTGGSGLRIEEGMRRLEAGEGDRLLISGVNPSVSLEDVAARTGGAQALYDCCVELGYQATTTRGNAREVADWADASGFETLILVTSDYHLPRARLLLESAAPGVTFLPAPARTKIDPDETFGDWRSFRGMVTEWAKWRVTQFVLLIT